MSLSAHKFTRADARKEVFKMKTNSVLAGCVIIVSLITGAACGVVYVEDFQDGDVGALDPMFNHQLDEPPNLGQGRLWLYAGGGPDIVTFNLAPGDYVDWASVTLIAGGGCGPGSATVEFIGTNDSVTFGNVTDTSLETYDTTGLNLGEIHTVILRGCESEFDDLKINIVGCSPDVAYYIEDFEENGQGAFDPTFNHQLGHPKGPSQQPNWDLSGLELLMAPAIDTVTFNLSEGAQVKWASVRLSAYGCEPGSTFVEYIGTNGSAIFSNTSPVEWETFTTAELGLGNIQTVRLIGFCEGGFDDLEICVVDGTAECPCPGDLNGDGQIDLDDLQIVADILLDVGSLFIVLVEAGHCADLNEDGQIDLDDLQAVADILLDAGSPFIVPCP